MPKRPTYDQLLARDRLKATRKRPGEAEHKLQCQCFQWFNWTHRDLQGLLYAVPNGGHRNYVTAAKLKAEGVVSGVSDLNLDVARHGYHGLRIELKTETGRQSPSQRAWQKKVEAQGYRYVLVRGYREFCETVDAYLDECCLNEL